MALPCNSTPAAQVPTPSDGFDRLERRIERLEDVCRENGAVMERAAATLDRIDARQEREWQARVAMEEARMVREDRREQHRASLWSAAWATVKGPLTTVLLAVAAWATIRLNTVPATATAPAPVASEEWQQPVAAPPQEPLPVDE
jgi:hypothetical protein